MKPLKIEGTRFTPKVLFNSDLGELLIAGFSLPENVNSFYDPIISWLDDYIEKSTSKEKPFKLVFKLTYYNSGTFKSIINILLKLSNAYKRGLKVEVDWYYDEDDYQLKDIGMELAEMVSLPFNYLTN
jgi:hypothetical protein